MRYQQHGGKFYEAILSASIYVRYVPGSCCTVSDRGPVGVGGASMQPNQARDLVVIWSLGKVGLRIARLAAIFYGNSYTIDLFGSKLCALAVNDPRSFAGNCMVVNLQVYVCAHGGRYIAPTSY